MKKYIRAAEERKVGPLTIRDNVVVKCDEDYIGHVDIPDGVTIIGWGAFWPCPSLKSVTIPDSVTSIGGSAFEYCTALTSVTIPDSVTEISPTAFKGCPLSNDVVIPHDEHTDDDDDNINFELSTWEGLQSALGRDCEEYGDPLYQCTPAGEKINGICQDVESDIGVWLEPSVQGGTGGIWVYDSDDHCIASNIDYATFNSDVVDIVLDSATEAEFKQSYEGYLENQIEAYSVDED